MVANTIWTPELLEDTLWALNRLITIAPPEKLSAETSAAAVLVRTWIAGAEAAAAAAAPGSAAISVAPFPLSHSQLIDLQVDVLVAIGQSPARHGFHVRRTSARRGNAVLARALFPLEHLEARLRQTEISSWLIAVGLTCLVGVNVLDLLVFGDLPRLAVFGVNTLAVGLVFFVWAFHHFHSIAQEWEALARHFVFHHHGHHPAG